MAYDRSYRDERSPYGEERDSYNSPVPYPTSSNQDYIPEPRQYQAHPTGGPPYPADAGAWASSGVPRPVGQPVPPQGVYDAVSNAVDNSSAANQLPEEVIRQIAEQVRSQVIDSLKKEGLAASPASAPPAHTPVFPPPPPPPTAIPIRQSPPVNREQFGTPPPTAIRDEARFTSPTRSRGNSIRSDASQSFGRDSYASLNGDSRSEVRDGKFEMKDNLGSRYGDRSESDDMPRRPAVPSLSVDEEPTTLEKIWQPLFDAKGEPTERLSQFLRGMALHIIEDYEPKNSLVITPTKLKKFYEDVRLDQETYPWHSIFSLSNSSISKIYRDTKVEHFYVQEAVAEPPSIPALTPGGFERWMTLHIQAHPQAEFERLARAVRDMPINNADDRKERFPKELSRRLLPRFDDLNTRQYCSSALRAEGQISIPNHTSFPPPPPRASQAPPEPVSAFVERERMPYATQSSTNLPETAIYSDTDEDLDENKRPPIPIERERKPYTAKEGAGKVYENDNSASSRTLRPEPMSATGTRHRNSIFADRVDLGNSSDTSSRANDHTATSVPHRARTYSKSSRRGPSPPTAGFVKSDSSVNSIPSDYYASNLRSGDKEDDRYRERDRERTRDKPREKSRPREKSKPRERDREPDRRDRDDRRERNERGERDEREYKRRYDEDERYDGELLGRRSTVESGYPGPAYGQFPPPLGSGERRYG